VTAKAPIDAHLLSACQHGDRAAFRQLFDLYRDRVYSIALHVLGTEAAAKDATQQVFLRLLSEIRRFRGDAQFSTWLYRLVVNACLDERRRQRRFVAGPPPEPTQRAGQEDAVLARQVRDAVLTLSPKLRIPLVLRHIEGLSYEEIARVLGCSPGTVASRLNRAHAALARACQEME